MGSPVTLSGFNNIDFGSVLNALMQQERIPVTQLETQQTALKAQQTAFGTFATRLAALESAAEELTSATSFQGRSASVSNTAALTASTGTLTPIGSYEIFVNELARAQVTGTNSTHADKDTTIVASGGTLVIGGTTVTISGDVTLQGLAEAINNTAGIEATASVVQNGANFQLVLTGNETGAANAFTITDNLTGGAADVNFDLATGQPASDASGTVNGIAFTSTTNVVEGAVPGATLTLTKKDPLNAVVLTITGDSSSVKGLVQKFTDAYNDIVKFIDDQQAAAGRKETNNIGRDPLVRGLRTQLSRTLLQEFGTGDFNALSQVGRLLQPDRPAAVQLVGVRYRALRRSGQGAGAVPRRRHGEQQGHLRRVRRRWSSRTPRPTAWCRTPRSGWAIWSTRTPTASPRWSAVSKSAASSCRKSSPRPIWPSAS